MAKKTPLYAAHVKAQGKMVEFGGWDMPLHYGSQLVEHHAVRNNAGVFDVSHMGIVDVKGAEALAYLRYLMANNVDRLVDGKALYTCMLNEDGGVIDDLIIYKLSDDYYRLVINAGTRDKDLKWLKDKSGDFKVMLEERTDLSMLALQGPEIKNKMSQLFPSEMVSKILELKPFFATWVGDWLVARTGYTGEDGFEIMLPAHEVNAFWEAIQQADIAPCGLGARDTLRLEAGLNLYGSDMDEGVSPLEANLAWTVAFEPQDRAFVGRKALEKQREKGLERIMVGLILEGPGIIRNHQKVTINGKTGEVVSGGYSPTLEHSIALARMPAGTAIGDTCTIEIRNKQVPARVVKPPFVRLGKKVFV